MIWNARISKVKKAGLGVMFCGGLITAIFGGLRCGYVLQNSPEGAQLAGEWSCRESFVAVFISNIPVLFPILHQRYKPVEKSHRSRWEQDQQQRPRGLPYAHDHDQLEE
jgi:hypothetical protein